MKKICATCGKKINESEEVRAGRYNEYTEDDHVFHKECLEEEYEYARDKGYM